MYFNYEPVTTNSKANMPNNRTRAFRSPAPLLKSTSPRFEYALSAFSPWTADLDPLS